jgi:hypothetical protein
MRTLALTLTLPGVLAYQHNGNVAWIEAGEKGRWKFRMHGKIPSAAFSSAFDSRFKFKKTSDVSHTRTAQLILILLGLSHSSSSTSTVQPRVIPIGHGAWQATIVLKKRKEKNIQDKSQQSLCK